MDGCTAHVSRLLRCVKIWPARLARFSHIGISSLVVRKLAPGARTQRFKVTADKNIFIHGVQPLDVRVG